MGVAPVQQLCYGSAAVSSRYARRDLRYAFTELLHRVDVCLILDQFGALITCPIQEGDGADLRYAFTELLHGVDVCLILDQFGALVTCPIQEGDRATRPMNKPPD
jgi:hypothetical protein